jgi:glycosyltransferase involved in cell wall biosynthesis
MRVLHVIDTLGLGGGAERNLAAVVPAMRDLEHHVVHLRPENEYAPPLRAAGIQVSCVPMQQPHDYAGGLRELARLARSVDVVHTQTLLSDFWGRLAAAAQRPIVTTVQFPAYEWAIMAGYSLLGKLKTAAVWAADLALSQRARRIVGVSEYVRRTVVEHLHVPDERTRVIYNAVPVGELRRFDGAERARRRAELGLDERDFVIISVGKLNWIKGQELLVEALPRILGQVPRAVLLLPGTGVCAEPLARRARELGLAERVRLLGLRDDVSQILGICDLFVLASRSEGLSLAVAEAMAASLPCLLSDIPPHREMQSLVAGARGRAVDEMVVTTREPAAYAAAMVRLAGDAALREELASLSRVVAERSFDTAVTAPALAAVLREAARA